MTSIFILKKNNLKTFNLNYIYTYTYMMEFLKIDNLIVH